MKIYIGRFVSRASVFAFAVSVLAGGTSADVVTNDYFNDVTSPTTLSGVTNIIAKSVNVNISTDLTLTDKTFLWFRGESAGSPAYVNLAPTAADATLTIEGNSGFFTAYRYSGDGSNATKPWGQVGIDEHNKNTPPIYYRMRIGTSGGAPASTGKGKIVVKTSPAFGYNAVGGVWAKQLVVESSVAPGADGYVDFLDIANGTTADISQIDVNTTAHPTRILFRGGMLLRNNATTSEANTWNYATGDRTEVPLAPVTGATLVLWGVDGADICLKKQFETAPFTARKGGAVRIVGKDLQLRSSGNVPRSMGGSANYHPWMLSEDDNVTWELIGDVCLKESTWLLTETDDMLPFGPGVGGLMLGNSDLNISDLKAGKVLGYCCLDLYGTRQHVNSLESEVSATDTKFDYRVGIVTNTHASARGTLVLGGHNTDGRLYARCTANVDVKKEGTGALTVENTTGERLIVENGAVAFSGTAVFTNIVVSSGSELTGTVRVRASLAGATDATALNLVLDADATISADGTLEVLTLTRDDAAVAAGVYTAETAADWVTAGKVVVLTRPGDAVDAVTWTGGGETTSASLAGNWSESDVAFEFPRFRPTFATGGAEALLDGGVYRFMGLTFDAPGDFSIRANGPSDVLNLHDTITVERPAADAARTYTIAAPIGLYANQTITLTTNTTVQLTGGCSTRAALGITLAGFKQSDLKYDYTDGGRLVLTNARVSGSIVHKLGGGWLVLQGDIGNPGDTAPIELDYIRYRNNSNGDNGFLYGGYTRVENATIWKPVDINGQGQVDGGKDSQKWFIGSAGTTNVFKERVTCRVSTVLAAEAHAEMVFEKGLLASGGSFNPRSQDSGKPATFVFNGPVNVTSGNRPYNPHLSTILVYNSRGNSAKVAFLSNSSTSRFNVDDAFDDTGFALDQAAARLELGTTHQKVTWLISGGLSNYIANNSGKNKNGTINGSYPSALEITGGAPDESASSVTNCGAQFTGWVKLEKSGAGYHRLLARAYESYGDIEVSGGTLAFDAGATWLNGTNVTVRGSGTLKVGSANTFQKDIAVVAEGANWTLDLTGTQRAALFTVDGEKMPGGVYDASHKTLGSHFIGTGQLVVKAVGFTILFR